MMNFIYNAICESFIWELLISELFYDKLLLMMSLDKPDYHYWWKNNFKEMKLMQEKENQEVTIVGELEKECLCVYKVSHSPLIVKSRPTLPHEAYSLPFIHRTLFSFCTMDKHEMFTFDPVIEYSNLWAQKNFPNVQSIRYFDL